MILINETRTKAGRNIQDMIWKAPWHGLEKIFEIVGELSPWALPDLEFVLS